MSALIRHQVQLGGRWCLVTRTGVVIGRQFDRPGPHAFDRDATQLQAALLAPPRAPFLRRLVRYLTEPIH